MTSYHFYLFGHLFFVFMLLGGEGVLMMLGITGEKLEGDVKAIGRNLLVSKFVGSKIMNIAALGLVVFGFLTAHAAHYKTSSTWIGVSFLLVIVATLIGNFILGPMGKKAGMKAGELMQAGTTQSDELQAMVSDKRGAIFGQLNGLIILSILVLMVWRPGSHFA